MFLYIAKIIMLTHTSSHESNVNLKKSNVTYKKLRLSKQDVELFLNKKPFLGKI